MSAPADAFSIPASHLLAAAKLLAEHAPHWLSAEGMRRHEAEMGRLEDQAARHQASYSQLQAAALQRSFGGSGKLQKDGR